MKPTDVFPGSTKLVDGIPPSGSLLLIGPSRDWEDHFLQTIHT